MMADLKEQLDNIPDDHWIASSSFLMNSNMNKIKAPASARLSEKNYLDSILQNSYQPCLNETI